MYPKSMMLQQPRKGWIYGMIRNDGAKYIKWPENVGRCYWAFDRWKDKELQKDIEKMLIDLDEARYLGYIKNRD